MLIREHPDGMAGVWTGGADDVQPVVSCLPNGGESLASSRPASGQRALLAEPGFVPSIDSCPGLSAPRHFASAASTGSSLKARFVEDRLAARAPHPIVCPTLRLICGADRLAARASPPGVPGPR